jgi:ribosomal protein S27E
MAYDVTCPTCGAAATVRSPFAKMSVCSQCSSTLWLDKSGVKAGPKMSAPAPAISGLFLGAEGKIREASFRVIGRLRYKYERGFWDEWLLLKGDGKPVWLSEDEGDLSLEREYSFKGELPPFEQTRIENLYQLSGHPFFVEEKGTAVCDSGEGELPFPIEPGEKIPYLEGRIDKRPATLEYDEDGPRLFLGSYLPMEQLEIDEASRLSAPPSAVKGPREAVKIDCPGCGGTLELRCGDETEMVVCEYCGSQIDARGGKYEILGKILRAGPKGGTLRVGMKGTLRGTEWEIVGRLRYRDVTP